ncbi:PD-(D/E)XK nuclease family protein [Halomonas sp.]|uniref:PD-(D/E)XK nuclease family protein n=1 Tax=Halomonas sp. TaxID=1486246 RepID=UPI003564C228
MSRYDGHGSSDTSEASTNATPTLGGIDPAAQLQPDPELLTDGLPYISKSRLKTYLTCPAKFYWKYWCGHRTPGSYHTEKGSRLHEAFEVFHLNLIDYVEEHGERPAEFQPLMPHWSNYAQWIEQFGNFVKFEERRWRAACESVVGEIAIGDSLGMARRRWLPVEVEAEFWLGEPPQSWVESQGEPDYVAVGPPVGEVPWMGRIDLMVRTNSLPGVEGNGVSIIDYKTGKVPNPQYRHEGIFTENEMYAMAVEPHFQVDYTGNYFPQSDTLLLEETPHPGRRSLIESTVVELQQTPDYLADDDNGPPANFDYEEQPLCSWDNANGPGNCHFYNICPSTWRPN